MRTIEEAIRAASACLAAVGMENPRLESEFLIAALLRVPRTRLLFDRHRALPDSKIQALRSWVGARQKRKPLAYVTGEQPFRHLTLKITSAVLVPRPETELLVEQAYRVLDRFETPVMTVDVGTGSGNIAICLSRHPKVERVIAIDRSTAALKVARCNRNQAAHGAPIVWLRGNLLSLLQKRGTQAHLIVANLPYVRSGEIDTLEPELHWEPRLALDGGPDGLRLIEPCIQQARDILMPGGVLLLEIGADQSKDVTILLDKGGCWSQTQVFRDLAGLPRIVQSIRKGK